MARGNKDLDHSLDDIIKRSKARPSKGRNASTQTKGNSKVVMNTRVSKPNNSNRSNPSTTINRRLGNATNDRNNTGRINSRVNRGAITKPQRGRNDARGGRGGGNQNNNGYKPTAVNGRGRSSSSPKVRGPNMSAQRNNTESTRRTPIDPKTLVITKAINKRKTKEGPTPESLVIKSNISHQQQQHSQINTYEYQNHQQNHIPPPPPPSRTTYNSPPAHQQPANQNSSGNTKNIVLVCNLDPRATAEDVGEACSTFGPILSCDVLLDPMGRPLNEAEIEFLYPSSAEECASKLDNTVADGRLLRARLQSSATLPVVPRYSSRTVVASARLAQGGLDNPQPQPIVYDDPYQNRNYRGGNLSFQQPQHQRRY